MSVRIELDNRGSLFTCLDYVTGKVVMNIANDETISAITVKMEGISRTRLTPPRNDEGRDSKHAEIENHRLLYLVQTVFPSPEIRENTSATNSGYTLKPGQYEYPFKLRIPVNSQCTEGQGVGGNILQRLSFDKGTADIARDARRHHPGTLPPSLSGIPGDEALIRYFLKVTVIRPEFYKFNLRAIDPFVFLPIEPPRSPPTTNETYARRQHQFIYNVSPVSKKRGLFSPFRQQAPAINTLSRAVHFSIEARLPSPAIIVPNIQLPLRVILVKIEPYTTPVFIRSLQIHLFAFTGITAHGLGKTDKQIITCLSLMGLQSPIGDDYQAIGKEVEADQALWANAALPDSVPPSFRTCNIRRTYELEIILGLSHGRSGPTEMVPLTLPIKVYSGIKPPPGLLETARHPKTPQFPPLPTKEPVPPLPPRTPTTQSLKVPTAAFGGYNSTKNSPVSSPVSPSFPARPHSSSCGGGGWGGGNGGGGAWPGPRPSSVSSVFPEDDIPPPTYEDTIAEDIGPVDGPRRRYEQEGAYYGALPDDVHA
ncbi:unnamed protein product [Tuber melanosporum]|uniref:(Perigord truffle) hypothetical protein n=1 Tax=Tuber melanosporum (strain Mel28) TaxID=656061 RepID=D5G680_TUBMM|nr:uncharacterized protein GSTUM_00001648001 [Tuber melanosporum]CAZ80023.1 unnamed protein product [Tuber melanosporum]